MGVVVVGFTANRVAKNRIKHKDIHRAGNKLFGSRTRVYRHRETGAVKVVRTGAVVTALDDVATFLFVPGDGEITPASVCAYVGRCFERFQQATRSED